jgi:hypothetical protein
MNRWLDLAQQAFESSSAYVDANCRQDWDYSLKAFRNEHASGSKYNSPEYQSRSRLFRPKTRSIIRKNEAAGAVALFSNMEVVNVTANNEDDILNAANAVCVKALLDYRLTKTIPWFMIAMGALQDAQTTGAVVSYQYWEYEQRNGRKIKDQPCIDLRPIENIRIDGGASWVDPVGTSPYFCDIIPMYVCDVRGMMKNKDEKTGSPKWKSYEDGVILKARPDVMDSTRKARIGNKEDPQDETTGIKDFDIVWVMRWFIKDSQGDDHVFYTLGTEELLTEAKPLEEVYFHGKRPYVMGCAVIETHKVLKTGLPMLIKPLQQESNSLANTRIDNVHFVLNKRWLVARGRQVDVPSLVRGVPGGVTLTTDPKNDVQESNWPDVTSSAYVEQDRLNADLDELAGNFSPNTRLANKGMNDTLGGSKLAAQGAGLMTDYLLRTVIETWAEPVLRQMVLLEQYYETDQIVLQTCANKAKLFKRFGISQITDDMLMTEVDINVNVGMGASNPNERFQKLILGTKEVMGVVMTAPPNFNVQEFIKESYSNMGYRDGSRFWSGDADPRLAKAMQMVQQLTEQLKGKQMEIQANAQLEQQKLLSNERIKSAELQVDQRRIGGDLAIRQAELVVEQQRLELEKLKIQVELQMAGDEHSMKAAELGTGLQEARLKLEGEQKKIELQSLKIAAEIEKADTALKTIRESNQNEERIKEISTEVIGHMRLVGEELEHMKQSIQEAHQGMGGMDKKMEDMRKGLGAMAGVMMAPKKKLKGLNLKKDGKRTKAVVVSYDDGSQEELSVA